MSISLVELVSKRKQESDEQVRTVFTPEQLRALELAGRYAPPKSGNYTIPYRAQAPSSQFGLKALHNVVRTVG